MTILSIVIPVHGNANFTEACLKDLFQLDSNHEIIVVDNGSTDSTAQICEKYLKLSEDNKEKPKFKVIKNETNLGFARACNVGYSQSSSPNIMFLNNDIRVKNNHSDWTSSIVPFCDNYIVGPTAGLIDKNANFIKEIDKIVDGNLYMSGWCLSSSRKNWDRLILPNHEGPFSTEFGLAYFEDDDLSFRAAQLKIPFKITQVPVIHFGRMTSKKIGISHLYKNAQKIFYKKWKDYLK